MSTLIDFWQNIALNTSQVAFSIGPIDVRYYSLAYLVGFAVVYLLLMYRLKTESFSENFSKEEIENLLMISFLGVVIGGRLGYILFYDFAYYFENPMQVVWPFDADGKFTGLAGMSFHGGLVGAIAVAIAYVRHLKWSIRETASLIVPCVPLGYMFGRIGNFLNNELWGAETDFFLGMYVKINGELLKLHPSQLYEAFFEGFVLFVLLWVFRKSLVVRRHSLAIFLFGYGFFRFMIEFIRVPDEHLGYILFGLSMGQLLCLIMMAAGVILYKFEKSGGPGEI